MWRNVQGRKEAVFKVNQKAHLLSLLTMIGPSPDWCIGGYTRTVKLDVVEWLTRRTSNLRIARRTGLKPVRGKSLLHLARNVTLIAQY